MNKHLHALVTGLSVLVALFCVGLVQAAPTETEALKTGHKALAARQWEKASVAFGDAYSANPRSLEAMHGLAAAAQAQGKRQQARIWMEKAIAVAPEDMGSLRAYVRLLIEQDARVSAENALRSATTRLPAAIDPKMDLGHFYLEEPARSADATDQFRAVLKLAPQHAGAHMGLARALLAQDKLEEASAAAGEAVRAEPRNATTHRLAADIALRRKQFEAALAGFERALALQPDLVDGHLGRGEALIHLGQGTAAGAAFDRACQLAPGNSLAFTRRAWAQEQNKRPDLAVISYREALRLDQDNHDAANRLASLLAGQSGRLDEALALARQAVRLSPTKAAYRETLARILAELGDSEGAIAAYEVAFAIDPTNPLPRQDAQKLRNRPPGQVASNPQRPAMVPMARTSTEPGNADKTIVATSLEGWRQAWQTKDIERYLAFYVKRSSPAANVARPAWEADRRRKLAKPGAIEVQTTEPRFEVKHERLATTFTQRYRSGDYSDTVTKRLEWAREDGAWKIAREEQL